MAKELGTGANNFFEEFRNADEASQHSMFNVKKQKSEQRVYADEVSKVYDQIDQRCSQAVSVKGGKDAKKDKKDKEKKLQVPASVLEKHLTMKMKEIRPLHLDVTLGTKDLVKEFCQR